MVYEIIRAKENYDPSFIKDFDEQQFFNIVKFVNELDIDAFDIYESLYKSKFNNFPDNYSQKRNEDILKNMKTNINFLETEKQGTSYEWVYIKRKEMENISYRYYFGINPENMYKLVEVLTKKFTNYGIPTCFKYQQEAKKGLSDRIILYADTKHKSQIESVLSQVYEENKELFSNCERALPWIYEANIPNVYIAPESLNHEKSYGERFANALLDSKKIFHYLYQENRIKNNDQLEVMKKIVISTLLRNGIFITKDNKRIGVHEQGITTFYDKDKNILKNIVQDINGNYHEVEYDSTIEAKKAFLNNFYSVKNVQPQTGVKTRTLSPEERRKEIYNFLYPNQNPQIHI